jgi:hypothetical protein
MPNAEWNSWCISDFYATVARKRINSSKYNKSRHLLCGWAKLIQLQKYIINSLYRFSLNENICLFYKAIYIIISGTTAQAMW